MFKEFKKYGRTITIEVDSPEDVVASRFTGRVVYKSERFGYNPVPSIMSYVFNSYTDMSDYSVRLYGSTISDSDLRLIEVEILKEYTEGLKND